MRDAPQGPPPPTARQAALVALELAARDETPWLALDDRARAGRVAALDALRAYTDTGVFPHNHTSYEPVAVFIDEHGTHCAVAEMLRATGFADTARALADEDNARRILPDEPDARVVAWAQAHGFTTAELSAIQEPGYAFQDRDDEPRVARQGDRATPRARAATDDVDATDAPISEGDAARTLRALQPELDACLAKSGAKRSRVSVSYAIHRDGRARGVMFAAPVDAVGAGCVRAALGRATFARADGAALAQSQRSDTIILRAPAEAKSKTKKSARARSSRA